MSVRWRVSDAHGLCVMEDVAEGRMVADFSPASTNQNSRWQGRREDAEAIVAAHNLGALAEGILRRAFAADLVWLKDGELHTFAHEIELTDDEHELLERLAREAEA
jgi:ectoine hydroxylase-related dioxygenase (phytanoyl-CoA dioxygenase family)